MFIGYLMYSWFISHFIHRENSPVTQTTPESTLLSWEGWPHEIHPPHPWPCCQTRFYLDYQATQTLLFSNHLMSLFDTQVYHECQICLSFYRILKVILEMAFSAHCTQVWNLNQISMTIINTLRPRQNGHHFADDTFKTIFLNENIRISIKISLKFVPNVPINIPALVQIMAWRWPGDKPLSEPMMVSLLTHICVTRPQWVNKVARKCNWCCH